MLDFVEFFVQTTQRDEAVSVNEANMQLAVHFVIESEHAEDLNQWLVVAAPLKQVVASLGVQLSGQVGELFSECEQRLVFKVALVGYGLVPLSLVQPVDRVQNEEWKVIRVKCLNSKLLNGLFPYDKVCLLQTFDQSDVALNISYFQSFLQLLKLLQKAWVLYDLDSQVEPLLANESRDL